jgi:hypothetical protein
MPINPDLYPSDWPAIARQVKEEAGWYCEECGRRCYQPGESLTRRVKNWRRVLTVAHLDRNPAHNERANLRALCVVCHLDYDRVEHVRKSKRPWTLKRAGPTIPMPL